jgi:Uri superfamily endonuclease
VLLAATTEQALQTLRHAEGATFVLLNTRGFRRAATRTKVITAPKESMIASKGVGTQKRVSEQARRKVREGWVVDWLNRRLQQICKASTLKRGEKMECLIHLAQIVRARASSA